MHTSMMPRISIFLPQTYTYTGAILEQGTAYIWSAQKSIIPSSLACPYNNTLIGIWISAFINLPGKDYACTTLVHTEDFTKNIRKQHKLKFNGKYLFQKVPKLSDLVFCLL